MAALNPATPPIFYVASVVGIHSHKLSWVDLTRSPRRLGMTAICTAVVTWAVPMTCDVKLTLTLARGSEVKHEFRRKKSSPRR
jgi:hypothetical protein